jgi:hypothetical protein
VPAPRTVADRVASPSHAGALEGAHAVGEARGGDRLVVRIGLWREGDRLVRARFKATTCAALVACADAACEAIEAAGDVGGLDAAAVRALVGGLHPGHRDRAALAAAALQDAARALATPRPTQGPNQRGAGP